MPTLAETAREIEDLHASGERANVDVALRIGELLEGAREKLVRSDFGRWQRDNVCIPKQTAHRHRSLYRFARENRAVVRRLAHLGPTRIARLARVRPEARAEVLPALAAPETCALSSAAFNELTRPYLIAPKVAAAPVPPATRHADALLADMSAPAPTLSEEEIAAIDARLAEICAGREAYLARLRVAASVPPVGPSPRTHRHPVVPRAIPRPLPPPATTEPATPTPTPTQPPPPRLPTTISPLRLRPRRPKR